MTLVNKSEFARSVGVSPQYIHKIVKQGKLPVEDGGKLDLEKCKALYEILKKQSDRNNQEWNEKQKGTGPQKAAVKKDKKGSDVGSAYQRARAMEMTLKVQKQQIEYKKLVSEVIEVKSVRFQIEQISNIVRTRLNKFGAKHAKSCEGLTAVEIQEILEKAVEDLYQEFQDGLNGIRKKAK